MIMIEPENLPGLLHHTLLEITIEALEVLPHSSGCNTYRSYLRFYHTLLEFYRSYLRSLATHIGRS